MSLEFREINLVVEVESMHNNGNGNVNIVEELHLFEMADNTTYYTHNNAASFWTQTDALLRKNLTYQKRNAKANCYLIVFPVLLCLLLFIAQTLIAQASGANVNANDKCDCRCDYSKDPQKCEERCGPQYSNLQISSGCPVASPPHWPALLHIPSSPLRAIKSNLIPFTDLANPSCRLNDSCPVTLLFTAKNQSLTQSLAANMFTSPLAALHSSLDSLADIALGSDTSVTAGIYPDDALIGNSLLYFIRHNCSSDPNLPIVIPQFDIDSVATCVQVLNLWRSSSSEINDELFKGYPKGNQRGEANQMLTAYDFLNSNLNTFNVSVWYYPDFMLRVPRLVNLVSNAYIQFLHGFGAKIRFDFVKEFDRYCTLESMKYQILQQPFFALLFSGLSLSNENRVSGFSEFKWFQDGFLQFQMHLGA